MRKTLYCALASIADGRHMEVITVEPPASKRRRTNAPIGASASTWALLPEEAMTAILSHCGPADLGQLSAVDWRLRRLALDERLWKAIYETAFPPCGPKCIAALGASVAGMDIAALVDRGLDLMLDPAATAGGCALPLPDTVARLGDFDNLALRGCRHHWPDVVAARGYRWAYATAVTVRPRFFGPRLDGSPPCLVGRTPRSNTTYRGDVVDTCDGAHIPHGYGTSNFGVYYHPYDSDMIPRRIHTRGASGQWEDGKPHGRAVAWCDPCDDGMKPHAARLIDRCVGFYQGHWAMGHPHGAGVLIGHGHGPPSSRRVIPSLVRSGPWFYGKPARGTRAWGVVATAKDRPTAGIGASDPLDRSVVAPGIVRAADGRVAFVGRLGDDGKPSVGRLLDQHGALAYGGDVRAHRTGSPGRLFLPDGCRVDLCGWRGQFGTIPMGTDAAEMPRHDRHEIMVVVTYPGGDVMRWRGNPARPAEFVYADGRACRPPLGWVVGDWCQAATPPARLLLQDTPFARDLRDDILTASSYIQRCVFWPRIAEPDDALAYAGFLDHMARCHGPQWVRCRAAVRLLWSLD
ncbi:F-box domain containing protein [Pandoravirus dulcis]|uniref:F-box domain containing protein n=1 Tax=Pandoravirus dulcis TaxID=1349409 RepID=S4VVA2_9VIRU|nr:F-box domain containing protein [Pandoravirus dulcis]AGO82001.2 F-box domain containing protein [Pandoravirus dulcis]